MNIQAKFTELREATENAKAMIEGLKGLGEHIFPQEKLEQRVDEAMTSHHVRIDGVADRAEHNNNAVIARCEQLCNEVVQLANSITARYETRFQELEANVSEIKEMLEGFFEAANKRRRK